MLMEATPDIDIRAGFDEFSSIWIFFSAPMTIYQLFLVLMALVFLQSILTVFVP